MISTLDRLVHLELQTNEHGPCGSGCDPKISTAMDNTNREGIMPNPRRAFDWQIFWLREVLFLSVPWLIAVFALPRGHYIDPARLEVLLSIQLCLTILNILWTLVASRRSEKLASIESIQGKLDRPKAKSPVQSGRLPHSLGFQPRKGKQTLLGEP